MSTIARYIWASPNTALGLALVPLAVLTGGGFAIVDGVLELHGAGIAWVLRNCTLIRGGAAAMTLGHVVLGRDRESLALTRVHERVHVRQYERWGPAFLPAYVLASVWGLIAGSGAYSGNAFEREAFDTDPFTRK